MTGKLRLTIHHDDEVEVYLNGALATKLSGWTTGYQTVSIADDAAKALRPGKNTIAVHCHQDAGGQYVDVGVLELVPASNP